MSYYCTTVITLFAEEACLEIKIFEVGMSSGGLLYAVTLSKEKSPFRNVASLQSVVELM